MLRNQLKKALQKREGFTLIEIILVLAIAGLILLIIFLAVAGAQRSQRDTARKDAVNRVVAAVISLVGNGTTTPTVNQINNAVQYPASVGPVTATNGSCPAAGTNMSNANVVVTGVVNGSQVCIGLETGGGPANGPAYVQTISL